MNTKNFKEQEFACKCCGVIKPNSELMAVLELVRLNFASPVTINSSYRCPKHNEEIEGAKHSKHLEGIAADIVVKNWSSDSVYSFLNKTFPNSYGMGRYKTFTHFDVRKTKARWDNR